MRTAANAGAPVVPGDTTAVIQPGLTVRSFVMGMLLALGLVSINSLLTLTFGVIEEGPTIAALFFFAFFFLSKTKITSHEMVIVATMGSAGGSLGFISNFFAAQVMIGHPYTFLEMAGFCVASSFIGLVFVIPLRQILILKENLPWPGSKATYSVIDALVGAGDRWQPVILFTSLALAIGYVVSNTEDGIGVVPDSFALPLGLAMIGGAISLSPFAIGGSYLMGMRTCVGFLVGAIILMIMAPYTPAPAAPHRYVWPGIGFLVASGITMLLVNWRMIADAMRSIVQLRGGSTADDDPIMSSRNFALFSGVVFVTSCLFLNLALDVSFLLLVVLIAVGGFLSNIIATRAAAQTAFNPARVMGILLQGVCALTGGTSPTMMMTGAGMVAGSGAQAGNLTGDLVYGRWFKVRASRQFWVQLATVIPCSLIAAWVFGLIAGTYDMSITSENIAAPIAKIWATTSLIFAGKSPMPPFAINALLIGAAAGVVYVLFERNERMRNWMPCSIGIGIGMVLPVGYDLSFFLGGFLFWIVLARWFKIGSTSLTSVAVACIVGEGIGGIIKPILHMAGVLGG